MGRSLSATHASKDTEPRPGGYGCYDCNNGQHNRSGGMEGDRRQQKL